MLHKTYELTDGSATYARLHDEHSGNAVGETSEGVFALSQVNSDRHFTVTDSDGNLVSSFVSMPWQPPGSSEPGKYHLKYIGGLPNEMRVSLGQQELIHITGTGLGNSSARVDITEAGRADSHLSILLLMAAHAMNGPGDSPASTPAPFGTGTFHNPLDHEASLIPKPGV
jgi:hypothetical protein